MENPFRVLVKAQHDESILSVAEKTNLSRNTITKIIALAGIPRQVRLETLDRLAGYFGYRVKVSLEKENES